MSDETNKRLDAIAKSIIRVNDNQELLLARVVGMQGQMDGMQLELENLRSDFSAFRAEVNGQFQRLRTEVRGYRDEMRKTNGAIIKRIETLE
ncbi:hypothetical protein SAMN04488498_101394 [Mesorhizobium albiziae]|uniref:Uncharacterized protein n=1 Tax=Neomesorhizobium albiziae TaxID=335020 RepID=A0A1I3VEN2_9HYPH|nr:hypothetical protein [Mesorhizobium albiziae]GLS28852.1 hypothetical protein GCM10007937_05590 [Mesorhizobium albiziae]SFJ93600.1 hypothetical protein SAMN04488498_101394 [Mesorhizobium albiziae]